MRRGRLLIIGAGGHAKVAGDCAEAANLWSTLLFFDDRWPAHQNCGPWKVAGKSDDAVSQATTDDVLFVAIGNNKVRLRLLTRFRDMGLNVATIIHPGAQVSPHAKLGAGTLVVAGAVINIGAELGSGCIANTGCGIDHECRLGDAVHVCPGTYLAGNVSVGKLSWIGLGSVVSNGISIGREVTVGAGAVVLNDVPDELTVVGIPARPKVIQKDQEC